MEDYTLHSCKEFIFSVGDLEKTSDFYTGFVGFHPLHFGEIDSSQLRFWNLPEECRAEEVLLQFEDWETGRLRLVKFHNVPQKFIRSGGQAWDTGGIYDIDLRVKDIQAIYREMQEMGWHGTSEPVRQEMGETFVLDEALVKGHDEVVIALVDRQLPPMPANKSKGFISHIYLSAMMVRDLATAHHFFIDQLGFQVMNEMQLKRNEPGENMFGLPYNLSDKATAKLELISPNGSRDGMLDILQFEGATGRDFSKFAVPPNRGILMYRFAVDGLENYYEVIQQRGVKIKCPLQQIVNLPYGKVRIFAVQSPDGAWIEFFEKLEN